MIEAAEAYAARGWVPIAISKHTKKPIGPWGGVRTPEDGVAYCRDYLDENVGLHLGDVSGGLVDVDLDCPEAIQLAAAGGLPPTMAVFGRESKPRSHYLYRCPGLKTLQLKDTARAMLLEVRGNNKRSGGKSAGAQTVAPGSVHHTGETIRWDVEGEPAEIEAGELILAARKIQLAVSLARLVIETEGAWHDWFLRAAGTMARGGVPEATSAELIRSVVLVTGDDRLEDRRAGVETTYAMAREGQAVATLSGEIEERRGRALGKMVVELSGGRVGDGDLPTVEFHESQHEVALRRMARTLTENRSDVYEHSGAGPVVIDRYHPKYKDGPRPDPDVRLHPVSPYQLGVELSRGVQWVTRGARGNLMPRMPSFGLMKAFLGATREERGLRPMKSLITAPTLAPDSFRPIVEPGYDEATGLYLSWERESVVIDTTDEGLERAKALYEELLEEFCWADPEVGPSVWLFGLLCALLKPAVGVTPMIFFDAPIPESGKSLAAELIGYIVRGRKPSALSMGWDEAEFSKRLDGEVIAGETLMLIDNVQRTMANDVLCQMITSGTMKSRVLGASGQQERPVNAVVLGTGNNARLGVDLVRRTLVAELDPGVENPKEIKYERSPADMVMANRGAYLGAALSMVTAYVNEGMLDSPLGPAGSFGGCDVLRGAVIWGFGGVDPFLGTGKAQDMDEESEEVGDVLKALGELYKNGEKFTASALAQKIAFHEEPGTSEGVVHGALPYGAKGNAKSIGRMLRAYRKRVISGRKLEVYGTGTNTKWYRVVEVG